ncbi:hypothetical protein [Streptomyces sp. NPDC057257]|uniref:hypothetical protein n=1 Tax=Streptomyces sp. NPDC057257 TaxID=3346071 RepID=UPI00363B7C0E
MSTARRLPHSRAWLRVLVLLFALLVPGAQAEVHAAPVASVETVEYDVLDAAVRPPADAVRRAVVPLRPAPLPAPAPHAAPGRPRPASPQPPYTLRSLRTVVLRC